uniref:LIN1-like protein n=1 Tax=Aceria tosichella TaxID=561515 RepID=A0A6G1S6I2_9ACAR
MADGADHNGATVDFQQPCSSGVNNTKKRKQPDPPEDILAREGPLTEPPIDNEYEHLDDDEDDDEDDGGCVGPAFNLKRSDYREIQEAQEKATITQYDDIKITPFNLEEELEEGEFDKAGNFIFKKKGTGDSDEEENDTWAESVNWAEVERKEREQQAKDVEMRDSKPEVSVIKRDKTVAYKEMLRLMRPDEIVKKTIQRLGNNVPKRKPFNKNAAKSKQQAAVGDLKGTQGASAEEARRKLDLMIELAHGRLEEGDIDIYQKSYEDLEEAIN